MCNVQYYNALIDFIEHYLKRERHKYTEWGWERERERERERQTDRQTDITLVDFI